MDSDELLRSHEGIRFQSPEKQLTDYITKKGLPSELIYLHSTYLQNLGRML